MTELTRSERTSRLLVARLDALASVASQLTHAEAERLVELASIAPMHAVALATLQAEKAEAAGRTKDAEAARKHVAGAGKVGILGYCWGGALSFKAACNLDGLACSV